MTLHIGHEKTGTTSIQRYLSGHYSSLGGPLYYPRSGRPEGVDQHRILFNFMADAQPRMLTDVVARELNVLKCSHAVMSCEMFSALQGKANDALKLFLKTSAELGWEVHVVCVVRKAYPFMRSLYMEGLKWGFELDFPDFIRMHLPRLEDDKLREIIEGNGASVTFLPYSRNGLLEQFLKTVDPALSLIAEDETPELNTRMPEWMAPFLLMTNRTFRSPQFTRQTSNAALQLGTEAPEWFDPDAFFALPDDVVESLEQIEKTDPVRKALFS